MSTSQSPNLYLPQVRGDSCSINYRSSKGVWSLPWAGLHSPLGAVGVMVHINRFPDV